MQGAGSCLPLKFYATHAWTLLCIIPWKKVWDDFPVHFYLPEKEWTVWALRCSAMLQAWRQKSSATDIIAKKGLGLNFFKSTSIGSSRGDIQTAPQNNKCKEAKKLCYISSQYHLYIDLRQLTQKTRAKCCISSPHHSFRLTDNSPQKNKKKKKVGYICAQCRNLNKDAWDWNISKGLTIKEDSFRHFRHFLYLRIFDATKMAMIKRNICLHNNLKLEAQKPVVATKEGLIKVNQSTGKKKYLEFSTNIRSSLTGQEWVSTTEEKTEARKSITLEAWFES